MYIMYVDESGDPGVENSPVRYYILTGMVVHELGWRECLDSLLKFRRNLRDVYGLKLREEIHAEAFINKPGELKRIKRNERVNILKKCIDWINSNPWINIITVCIDKLERDNNVFELAWKILIQRFENTIANQNFRNPVKVSSKEKGLIISDNTDSARLTKLLRRMRRYNPIPNKRMFYEEGYRNLPLTEIVEDPIFRNSKNSLFHQMVDVVSYCARQLYEPNKYMRKKGGNNFYKRLGNVLVKEVAPEHPLGIVEI